MRLVEVLNVFCKILAFIGDGVCNYKNVLKGMFFKNRLRKKFAMNSQVN